MMRGSDVVLLSRSCTVASEHGGSEESSAVDDLDHDLEIDHDLSEI